jgi:VWFA-related protein
MSVDVKVVTLPVTVRDKHGQIIRNLTKEDFVLEEDGHPQTIRYFAQEAKLPLTLGLLVDTSLSQPNVLDQEQTASKSFLDQMLTSDTEGGGWPGGCHGGGGRRGGGQRSPQEARPDGKKLGD